MGASLWTADDAHLPRARVDRTAAGPDVAEALAQAHGGADALVVVVVVEPLVVVHAGVQEDVGIER